MSPPIFPDKETLALQVCVEKMLDLNQEARDRVIQYLEERFQPHAFPPESRLEEEDV